MAETSHDCYFIATSWNPSAASRHFRVLAQRLVERGHRVVLLVGSLKRHVEDHQGNPAVYALPSPRPTSPADARFLNRLIRKHCPDCLVSQFSAVNLLSLLGWLNRVPCRVAWYRTLAGQIDEDTSLAPSTARILRHRKRFFFKLATAIVANSEASLRDLRGQYHVPAPKCVVFHNALADPLDTIDLHDVLPDPQKIVCVGRLDPSKGQDTLIRAVACLTADLPALTVEFIGAGASKDRYRDLARDLGVRERCLFLGEIPHDEVFRKMAQSCACVVPSRSEAFGWVNIESLAVGTPVVASKVGGIVEIVRDGVEGLLVPPDNPRELADALARVVNDQELRAEMGRNARRRFLDAFEQRKALSNQVAWLEDIVQNARR